MWRALFLAVGLYVMILGAECLAVENVKLKLRDAPPPPQNAWETPPTEGPQKVITPPRWAPWSLMSTGAVVCLYSFTIPRRMQGN
ncbi:MAG: hypothetical protein HQ567_10715 [Candidatus Nealsonbacteria bacterium]|nr:hypothetical protein [Candidatus Nealsonbacteria bacterium]